MTTTRRWVVTALLAGAAIIGALATAGVAVAYPAGTSAQIGLGSSTVQAGASTSVTGAHFHPNTTVTIEFESTPQQVGSVVTGDDGTFSTTVTIPSGATNGGHHIVGTDAQGESASAALTVTGGSGTGGVTVSDPTPSSGGSITVSGTGCTPDADISVSLDDGAYSLGSTTADDSGSYSLVVKLPAGVTGNHTVTVDGDGCSGVLGVEIGSGGGSDLAGTGVAVIGLGALGVVLLVGGGLMVMAGRRRRPTSV